MIENNAILLKESQYCTVNPDLRKQDIVFPRIFDCIVVELNFYNGVKIFYHCFKVDKDDLIEKLLKENIKEHGKISKVRMFGGSYLEGGLKPGSANLRIEKLDKNSLGLPKNLPVITDILSFDESKEYFNFVKRYLENFPAKKLSSYLLPESHERLYGGVLIDTINEEK